MIEGVLGGRLDRSVRLAGCVRGEIASETSPDETRMFVARSFLCIIHARFGMRASDAAQSVFRVINV